LGTLTSTNWIGLVVVCGKATHTTSQNQFAMREFVPALTRTRTRIRVRRHSRVSLVLRLPSSLPTPPRRSGYTIVFAFLVEWNDVRQILALQVPGTDIINFEIRLAVNCSSGTSDSLERFVLLHCFSSQTADATVRNRLRDNEVFFCGLEHTRRSRAQ